MKKERSTATLLLYCFPNPITAINHLFRQMLSAQGAEPTALSYLPLPPLFPPASPVSSCLLLPPLFIRLPPLSSSSILFHPLPSSIIRSKNHALQQKTKKKRKIPCQCKIN